MIATNNILSWDDIASIYNNLNTQRQRFGLTNITTPEYKDYLVAITQLQELKNQVESLSSVGLIGSVAQTNMTLPSVGQLIKPIEYNKIEETINDISGLCVHYTNYTADHSSNHSDFSDFADYSDDSDNHSDFSHQYDAHNRSDFSSQCSSNHSDFSQCSSNHTFNFTDFDAQDYAVNGGF